MKTKEKLAIALIEAKAPEEMILRATKGYYDDYESSLEMPCLQLVLDCNEHGLKDLASRAKDGEFDGTKEESEEWFENEGKYLLSDVMRKLSKKLGDKS